MNIIIHDEGATFGINNDNFFRSREGSLHPIFRNTQFMTSQHNQTMIQDQFDYLRGDYLGREKSLDWVAHL